MSSHTTKGELTGSVGHTYSYDQMDIFSVPPASRRNDPLTSKIAGSRYEVRSWTPLHRSILEAISLHGALMDETLERMPAFAKYAPSTVRKRRSELFARWRLVEHGLMTNSRNLPMTCWSLAPWDEAEADRRYRDLGKQELRREAA